jgi:sialate O-acetylesterase
MMKQTLPLLLTLSLSLLGPLVQADVRLPASFGDHMVLQRNVALPLWGWATPGERVTVRLAGKEGAAMADKDGLWRITLAALKAGGPYELSVQGKNSITLKDVLIGEVWLCSGQSNMAMALAGATNAEEALREADCPPLRLFSTPYTSRTSPQMTCGGQWKPCTPETARDFSATAYFFGRRLQRELGVPVGLVQSAVGATAIESWVTRSSMVGVPELKSLVTSLDNAVTNYPAEVDDAGWQTPETADADWREMTLPQAWEGAKAGMDTLNGVVWFRRTVEIPAGWAGKDLALRFGPIDDGDTTYFNGVQVGAMNMDTPNVWKTPRDYTVPASLVKSGRVVVAVRASDQFGGGGFLGTPDQMSLSMKGATNEVLSLAGSWRFRIAASWPQNELPTGLFNGMIAPWTRYAIGGLLWYQGESNAGAAGRYRHLLPTLINGWRLAWGQGDLPFLIVQLPNYKAVQPEPGESQWAELREAQALAAATLPQVGLAVTIDVGDEKNIHPGRKQEVGDRLALQALGLVYKTTKAYSGPVCVGMTREGDTALRLRFSHAEGGLRTVDGGPVQGFAVAGADGKFVWATATIEGDTVVVSSPAVTQPTKVRYAWADNPSVNLTNGTGLPAGPFRL